MLPLVLTVLQAQSQGSAPLTHTVTGRVTESLHGRALPRALVNLSGRTVLTDSLGRFTFPGFTGQQAYAAVSKPGYSNPAEENGAMTSITSLDEPLELRLDPDGVVIGTLTGRDGLPISRAGVTLSMVVSTAAGLTPAPVAYSLTDSHGAFRFQRPAGQYRVNVRYEGQLPESGVALLPVEVPDASAASRAGYFSLGIGEERRVDITADTGTVYPVLVQVSGAAELGRRGMRVLVKRGSGPGFETQASGTGAEGQYLLKLPAGSYDLHFLQGDATDPLEAMTHVTVSARSRAELAVALTPQAQLPVEAGFDLGVTPAAPAQGQPALTERDILQRLLLALHGMSASPVGRGESIQRLTANAEGTLRFIVPAGSYRLAAQGSAGDWYVSSATFGSSNLMTDDLALAGGAAGAPIRVTLSNLKGKVSGTVDLPAGVPAAWIYLIPRQPSLTSPPMTRTNAGTWSLSAPTGVYIAVAVSEQLHEDFRNPAVLARLGAAGQAVTVTSDGQASAALRVVPAHGVQP